MDIGDKIVIITGGAGGIGFEICRALLHHGAKMVAIFDLPESNGAEKLEELKQDFGNAHVEFYPVDISDHKDVKEKFEGVISNYGPIDILINNAAASNEEALQRLVDVNVTATLHLSLLAITHMGRHKGGKGGLIVNVNGILGISDYPMLPCYSATKHAIIGFTRCMKENFIGTGVRVVSVCPGVTRTNLIKDLPNHILDFITDRIREKTLTEVPVQSPKSVALAVIEIINKAEPGAVWVVEDDKEPFAIKPADHYLKMSVPIRK
ncbi:hypothetical protein QAD02_016869 [Eretmocerus hayati]|uniref:Uncharacterized protein n=1 Tax=Eretmocerus hayati TaxID=131215 RepID=A0ACC2PCP7_9HYME|nr:hypothetical protein QAD02_016869 [Eretmocerus hayati]